MTTTAAPSAPTVELGQTVTLRDTVTGCESTYTLTAPAGLIERSLLGQRVGQDAYVQSFRGGRRVQILAAV